jgi:hypothetical protein
MLTVVADRSFLMRINLRELELASNGFMSASGTMPLLAADE